MNFDQPPQRKVEEKKEIFTNAIDYLEKNKKIVIKQEDIHDMYTFSDTKKFDGSAWFFKKGDEVFVRFFDEEGNVAEVPFDGSKLYDVKNDPDFSDLDEDGINSVRISKFRTQAQEGKYHFNVDKDLISEVNGKIE
ncbi:MAG: hypothetical protein WCI41_03345 [bacterium]